MKNQKIFSAFTYIIKWLLVLCCFFSGTIIVGLFMKGNELLWFSAKALGISLVSIFVVGLIDGLLQRKKK